VAANQDLRTQLVLTLGPTGSPLYSIDQLASSPSQRVESQTQQQAGITTNIRRGPTSVDNVGSQPEDMSLVQRSDLMFHNQENENIQRAEHDNKIKFGDDSESDGTGMRSRFKSVSQSKRAAQNRAAQVCVVELFFSPLIASSLCSRFVPHDLAFVPFSPIRMEL
jgi:hypothetical protein